MGGIIVGPSQARPNRCITYKINILSEEPSKRQQKKLAVPRMKRLIQKLKMKNSFVKSVERCATYIANYQYHTALPLLKKIIQKGEYLDTLWFKGAGNQESWNGYFKEGAMGWFQNTIKQVKQGKQDSQIQNAYDLLCLCFCLHIKKDSSNLQECCQWYEKAIQDNERYELYFGLANLYYNSKNYIKAECYYKKSLKLNNRIAKTYQYLAWIYGCWFEYYSQALKYATKSLQLGPQSITCQYVLAICTQPDEKQLELLQKIIEKDKKYYRVYVDIGQLQKLKVDAQFYYKKALAYLKLGNQEQFWQNYQEAYQLYMKVKQIDQFQDSVYVYLGFLSEEQGKYNQALAYYQLCLQVNPNNTKVYATIAQYYKNLGEIDQAIFYMHKQLQQNPYDYQSANQLGIYYDSQEQLDKAMHYFSKAIQINSQFYNAYLNLGSSYQQKGQYQKAIMHYTKANQIDPTKADIYFGLAICQGETHNTDAAIDWCKKCIEKGGDQDKEVYYYLGDLYKGKKDYQQSLHTYIIHSMERRSLNTVYILSNLIRQIDRSLAIKIIQKEITVQNNNEFFFAQLGKISLQLQLQEISAFCFDKLQKISQSQQLHRDVDEELQRFKGNSSHIRNNYKFGTRSYSEKLKLIILKKNFEKNYLGLYGL